MGTFNVCTWYIHGPNMILASMYTKYVKTIYVYTVVVCEYNLWYPRTTYLQRMYMNMHYMYRYTQCSYVKATPLTKQFLGGIYKVYSCLNRVADTYTIFCILYIWTVCFIY
jgi:hypothetical protein